jgi:hypothetical protein
MRPPSLQAGEFETWVALTDTVRTDPPQYTSTVPTAALFILSDLLHGNSQRLNRTDFSMHCPLAIHVACLHCTTDLISFIVKFQAGAKMRDKVPVPLSQGR